MTDQDKDSMTAKNNPIIADAVHLFLYGHLIDTYPGWVKKGGVWHYEV